MSREIKFRVWGETEKEYIRYPFAWLSLFDSPDGLEIEENEDLVVEEYTGLTDKNDKEIYEGDILETCCGKAEVYFDDELLMYRVKVRHGGTMPLVSKKSKRHFDYEVIGNIHENLELVEVK